ncbi:hypothetical protein GCM10007962_24780 [Yeosuana aromativorans]|uniref:Uncharacterized protein n=1 Tax=Yeosuana aromativorans TaxID=288019 RepID=A0A8J3FIG4_9FLAO|nr:hypothetical protein GCM10007962_24780 [Yeosuana aromativorans]
MTVISAGISFVIGVAALSEALANENVPNDTMSTIKKSLVVFIFCMFNYEFKYQPILAINRYIFLIEICIIHI